MGFRAASSLSRLFFALALAFLPVATCMALQDPETEIPKVAIISKLGQKIDLGLQFTDSDGKTVALRDLILKDRPLIIIPAYYECPRLCGLLLQGVTKLLNGLELTLGKDFTVATASFNPEDTPERAKERATQYRAQLTHAGVDPASWHFLVGSKPSIDRLMQSLGFEYLRDGQEYAHSAAIFMITSRGELSQFLAGIEFDPRTARYALIDASQGSIGSALDQVFLFCFRYDHMQGKYTWVAFNIMRTGGLLTLSFLAFLIYRLRYSERRGKSSPV